MSKNRNKQFLLTCYRPKCKNKFKRSQWEIQKVKASYCSQSCSATYNNTQRIRKIRVCAIASCFNQTENGNKYCCKSCIPKPLSKYNKKLVIIEIRSFVKKNNRIPTKRERMCLCKPARKFYGTWNKAIKASGFNPNPVMFANKYTASDGHKCDSLSEMIIDDWLYRQGIKHEVDVEYPSDYNLTVDFLARGYWIEFFGLYGKHKAYDRLRRKKLKIAKEHKLKFIEVYPKHLFPINKLEKVLGALN